MNNSNTKYFIVILIIVFSIIGYIIYKDVQFEKTPFNKIDISTYGNVILNYSNYDYIDTIAAVMLHNLGIDSQMVVISNMKYSLNLSTDEYEYDAFVIAYPIGVYHIFIKNGLSKSDNFRVMAHEIIHLKQYYDRRLVILDTGIVIWENDTIRVNEVYYKNRGWEIEAFSEQYRVSNEAKKRLVQ